MELYQLKSFVAVAEEGNLTRAAMRLFSSQPSVSAHIKSLEDELGILLFDRTARGMQITPDGESLLERAYAILKETTELNNLARNLQSSPSGKLAIGVNSGSDLIPLETIASALHHECPKLQLEFTHGGSGDIMKGLLTSELDVGFFEGFVDSPKLISATFAQNHVIVIGSPAYAKNFETENWADLAELPWAFNSHGCSYHQVAVRVAKAHDIEFNKRFVIDCENASLKFVRAGSAISIMDERLVQEDLATGKLVAWKHFREPLAHNLGCLGSRYHERSIQAFFQAAKSPLNLPPPT